jgi:hypothetical protein
MANQTPSGHLDGLQNVVAKVEQQRHKENRHIGNTGHGPVRRRGRRRNNQFPILIITTRDDRAAEGRGERDARYRPKTIRGKQDGALTERKARFLTSAFLPRCIRRKGITQPQEKVGEGRLPASDLRADLLIARH